MKKLLAIFLATAVCGSVCQAATSTYLPLKETSYIYRPSSQEWIESTNTVYTVDGPYGRYATMSVTDLFDDIETKTVYTYNDFGMLSESVVMRRAAGSEEWKNQRRIVAEYDNVVPGFCTQSQVWSWSDDWQPVSGTRNRIVRNGNGAVTRHMRSTSVGANGFETISQTQCTVSDDGSTITAIKYYNRSENGNGLTLMYELRDIKWLSSNGQYLSFSPIDVTDTANRMLSATVYSGGDEATGQISAADISGAYSFRMADNDTGAGYEYFHTVTDVQTGSYRLEQIRRFMDYTDDRSDVNCDGIVDVNDMVLRSTATVYTVEYDTYGNIILRRTADYKDGEFKSVSVLKNEYEYDADGHVMVDLYSTYSSSDEYAEPVFTPKEKTVYSDFYDFSAGVVEVAAEAKAAVSVAGRTLTVSGGAASTLTVVALDGKTVATAAGEGSYSVALDGLVSGVYVAAVRTDGGTVTAKIALR